jgi:hypothetical protein
MISHRPDARRHLSEQALFSRFFRLPWSWFSFGSPNASSAAMYVT